MISSKILSENSLLRKIERDIIINVRRSSCKVALFLSELRKFEFFVSFSKNTPISEFIKSRWLGAELFHTERQTDTQTSERTDGQTDMTELIVALRDFANIARKSQKKEYQYRLRRHGERYGITCMFQLKQCLHMKGSHVIFI